MRNIPPCGSCHGDIDVKAGSPWLGGQSAVYIKAQLQAFATGARRNDIQRADAQHRPPDGRRKDRPGRRATTKPSRKARARHLSQPSH